MLSWLRVFRGRITPQPTKNEIQNPERAQKKLFVVFSLPTVGRLNGGALFPDTTIVMGIGLLRRKDNQ
jgi:hypothetical protein